MNEPISYKALKLSRAEAKVSLTSAFIVALRLFGLFMILPVFSIYALQLSGANPMNIGLTLGLYGLAAMLFQPIFGYLSDHHGRLQLIAFGLVLFVVGSLTSTFATSIYTMMGGRLLQGAGAIGSVMMALVADHTRPNVRSKAMALIGMFITFGFILAMIVSPILTHHLGLKGLFAVSSVLGLLALACVIFLPRTSRHQPKIGSSAIHVQPVRKLMLDPNTRILNVSVLFLHGFLIANFTVLPNLLTQNLHISLSASWWLYLLTLIPAFILMLVCIIIAEKYQLLKHMVIFCILLLTIAEIIFYTQLHYFPYAVAALVLFFTAFITLEALLPSWLTRLVAKEARGTALGIYATCQFLGAFLGGCLGGYVARSLPQEVFLYLTALGALWFIYATQSKPKPVDAANDAGGAKKEP